MAAGNFAAGHECGSCAGDDVAIPLSYLLQSGMRHAGRKQGMDRVTGWRLDFAGRDRAANADDRVCGCLAGEVLSSDSCAGWLDGRSRPRCWPARGAALNRCLVMVGAEHGEKWVGSFTTSARRACLRAMDRTIRRSIFRRQGGTTVRLVRGCGIHIHG